MMDTFQAFDESDRQIFCADLTAFQGSLVSIRDIIDVVRDRLQPSICAHYGVSQEAADVLSVILPEQDKLTVGEDDRAVYEADAQVSIIRKDGHGDAHQMGITFVRTIVFDPLPE